MATDQCIIRNAKQSKDQKRILSFFECLLFYSAQNSEDGPQTDQCHYHFWPTDMDYCLVMKRSPPTPHHNMEHNTVIKTKQKYLHGKFIGVARKK